MSQPLPPCPECRSNYVYADQAMLLCPECGYEWNPEQLTEAETQAVIKDANGAPLEEGDKVTLIKDLKVKGSSTVLKVGTKALIKRIVSGDHDLDCKVDGAGAMMLKSEFVKKA